MNPVYQISRAGDLDYRNREERRMFFKRHHNKVFPGQSWSDVNDRVRKKMPYVNPNRKSGRMKV